jgi:hypothetical protein
MGLPFFQSFLSTYYACSLPKWEHNQCVQDAVKNVRSGTALLEESNTCHTIRVQGPISIYTYSDTRDSARCNSGVKNPTEQVHVHTTDPYSAQQIAAQAMAPKVGTV